MFYNDDAAAIYSLSYVFLKTQRTHNTTLVFSKSPDLVFFCVFYVFPNSKKIVNQKLVFPIFLVFLIFENRKWFSKTETKHVPSVL